MFKLSADSVMEPYVTYAISTIAGISVDAATKVGYAALLWAFSFLFSPAISTLLLVLLAITTVDAFTGIAASYKRGVPIKSRCLIKSAVKLFVYLLMVSTGHLVDLAFGITSFPANSERLILAFLVATEALSIFENLSILGYSTPRRVIDNITRARDSQNDIESHKVTRTITEVDETTTTKRL